MQRGTAAGVPNLSAPAFLALGVLCVRYHVELLIMPNRRNSNLPFPQFKRLVYELRISRVLLMSRRLNSCLTHGTCVVHVAFVAGYWTM